MLVDGRGVPLASVISGANCHDVTQLEKVLNSKVYSPKIPVGQNLCADAGYRGEKHRQTMIKAGYIPHVRSRYEEKIEKERNPDAKARRWVVEACHSWLNRFRKLAIRYEKLTSSYMALLHLASSSNSVQNRRRYLETGS
jgi:transposase